MLKQSSALKAIISAILTTMTCLVYGQQITIVSADVNSFNITPKSLCQVVLMNPVANVQVRMQAQLMDAANEPLLTIQTNPFTLHSGMNTAANMTFSIESVVYGTTSIVPYIRNGHMLPAGKYSYCVKVTVVAGNAEEGDDYCEDVVSNMNTYLYLVSPGDQDTISTLYPILVWNHSDPFNTLTPGEYYRMVLVPVNKDQTADEAVSVNTPIFLKNNLHENQVQYPFDATKLEAGKSYGWQVQLVSNDVVLNKTDAWEFTESIHKKQADNRYATLSTTLDGGFYTAANNRIFFRFSEAYAAKGKLDCIIYDSKMQKVSIKTTNVSREKDGNTTNSNNTSSVSLTRHGYNQYEVDLDEFNVSTGFYYLQVKNGKGRVYKLKFYVQ